MKISGIVSSMPVEGSLPDPTILGIYIYTEDFWLIETYNSNVVMFPMYREKFTCYMQFSSQFYHQNL